MQIAFIIAIIIVIVSIPFYPKWSVKAWYKRAEKNVQHPNFTPYCGKYFLD